MTDLIPQSTVALFNRHELGRCTPEHLPPLPKVTADYGPVSSRTVGRLALAAPGSEAGSGLINLDDLHPAPRRRPPTPPPRPPTPARLAVSAPASWGSSGVVDVQACLDAVSRSRSHPEPDDGFVYLATRDLEPFDDFEADDAEDLRPGPGRGLVMITSALVTIGLFASLLM